jgi:hypothetical protein
MDFRALRHPLGLAPARLRNAQARAANQKIAKGGSFLCHFYRYRIAARSGTSADSGSSDTGLRVFYEA